MVRLEWPVGFDGLVVEELARGGVGVSSAE